MPEAGKQTPLWDFTVLVIALSRAHVSHLLLQGDLSEGNREGLG